MSTGITFATIKSQVKKNEVAPLYLLHGEEDFYIDQISHFLEENLLTESERSFNQSSLYGRDITVKEIRDIANRLPMMAPRQVLIIREAQEVRSLGDLADYAEKFNPSTVLVICHKHKKIDKRTRFFKTVEKHGVVFESPKIYDNQVPDWITRHLKENGFEITPEAANMTAEFIGTQLSKLANELEKLTISRQKGSRIEVADIQNGIGISREYNPFELQKAISLRKVESAYFILDQMMENTKINHPVMIVGILANFFSKLFVIQQSLNLSDAVLEKETGVRSFQLKEYKMAARAYQHPQLAKIIGILHEYDLKLKGVGSRHTKEEELMKEMVHAIFAA